MDVYRGDDEIGELEIDIKRWVEPQCRLWLDVPTLSIAASILRFYVCNENICYLMVLFIYSIFKIFFWVNFVVGEVISSAL